jgi:hypothetical protein
MFHRKKVTQRLKERSRERIARENCNEKIFEFECPKECVWRRMRESLQLLFDSLCLKLESKELELCS